MVIKGEIILNAFAGMYHSVMADDIVILNNIVNTWYKKEVYQTKLMREIISPNRLLYISGSWENMSEATIIKASDGHILFKINIDFTNDTDEEDYIDSLTDSDWHEWVRIPFEDPYSPAEYLEFEIKYDTE